MPTRSTVGLPLFVYLALATTTRAAGPDEDLHAAARAGDLAAVKAAVEKGADVNTRTEYGATALSYACDRGHVEVVRFLIERGANVNRADTFYQSTPLTWAAFNGHSEVVKLLLEHGALGANDVLTLAVSQGDADLVQAVIDGGKPDASALSTALVVATQGESAAIVALLQKAGTCCLLTPLSSQNASTSNVPVAFCHRSNSFSLNFQSWVSSTLATAAASAAVVFAR